MYTKIYFFRARIQKEDIERIAGWGMDHIRLPIDYDVIQEEDETFKEDGMKNIDDCIAWCREYGLNIILDLHYADALDEIVKYL